MSLNSIRPGLRTIHNGSNGVAKASIVVPSGGELTVPDGVADQLQRDGAFKDGPTPQAFLDRLAAGVATELLTVAEIEAVESSVVSVPAEVVPPAVVEPVKAKPVKRAAKKHG